MTNEKLAKQVEILLERPHHDNDTVKLEKAMDYFCDMFDIREGFIYAIELTLENADLSEKNKETKEHLTELIRLLK